jgi:hypothetical protein
MDASVILATASDDAVTWGIIGICFVVLALGVALLAGFIGRARDE